MASSTSAAAGDETRHRFRDRVRHVCILWNICSHHEAITKVFKTFIAFGSLCVWYISSGIIEKQAHQTGQIAPPKMSEHNDR